MMEKQKMIKKEKKEESNVPLKKKIIKKEKEEKPKVPLTKKQELNDYYIVRMRKAVAQTKVQLINKLVREVKKLKDRKPGKSDNQSKNDKVVEKAKRKADRLLEEMNFIKHVNKDAVSKYALLNKKTLDEVLQDPKSSLETRCLARFAPWKLIRTEVEKYRANNPNWELQIPLLLVTGRTKRKIQDKKIAQKTAEEKELLKDFNQERKTVKGKPNTNDIDKSDKNIEELLKFQSSESEDSDESENEEQEIESKSESDLDSEDSDQEEEMESEPEQQSSDSSEAEEIVEQVPKDKLINKKGKIEKPQKQMLNNKSEGAVKVQFLKSLDDLEDDEQEQEVGKLPVTNRKENHSDNNKRPKSSFFVGGTEEPAEHEEFKSQHTKYTDNLNRKERRGNQAPIYKKGKLINKPQNNRHQQNFNKNDNRPPQHSRDSRYFDAPKQKGEFQEKSQRFNTNNKEKFNDYNNSNKSLPAQQPLKSSSKLHPSWEAKKKLNISTTEFQGKKIKFSQD